MGAKFYDPDQVVCYAAGAKMQGFADGEAITVEMDNDAFGDVVGTDGEVARSKSNDLRGTATIKLLQTSSSNDVLSAAHNVDLAAPNGAGVFPFQITQTDSGRLFVFSAQAWVAKPPDVSLDRTAKSREWKIRLAKVTRFDGGSGA